MKINARHYQILFTIGLSVLIFWFGRLSVQYQLHKNLPPIQITDEENPKIPQVIIQDIQDARVLGTVNKSEIRIVSGDEVAIPDQDLDFSLNIEHLGYIGPKRKIITKEVPEWAKFVASKSGKYYYPLDERSLKKLSVKNQVYFATMEEAEAAGKVFRER